MTVSVKVKPGSKKDRIEVLPDGTLAVRIKARPVKGAANEYLVKYLAGIFGIRQSAVRIEKGLTSSIKLITLGIEEQTFATSLRTIREADSS